MKLWTPVAAVLGLMLLAGCATSAETMPGQQIPHTFEQEVLVRGQYLLYLPEAYEQQASWPLLLFLHGAGERGGDLDKVKIHGPPKLVAAGQDMPFIVVSPQVPEGQRWSVTMLDGVLKEVVANYNVDEDRIYVTGLSMGGFGTWDLAIAFPDRFAAIAPVCGGGAAYNACTIKDVPVWTFHGTRDTVVPIERSQEMVDALEKCGGDVRFTIYPDAGHDAWTETYANPDLYNWFLQHQRQKARR